MLTLEELGLTKDEIQDRVISKMANSLLENMVPYTDDETGEDGESPEPTKLQRHLEAKCRGMIDVAVNTLADKLILPNINAMIEGAVLQKTNQWGEKTGKAVTFIEYLVDRAEKYMAEPLSYDGKTKEQDSYSWKANCTRVEYMIQKHLQYSIESMMKTALADANKQIAGGIESGVKMKLTELLGGLKVSATVK